MSLNANAILTLDAYKQMMAISTLSTKTDDTQIELHINAASDTIEKYLARGVVIPAAAINEEFEGNGTYEYHVRHSCINSGTTPTLYYWSGTDWTELNSTSYPRSYDSDIESGRIFFTSGNTFWSPNIEGYRNWKIAYKYGYAVASVPDSIRNACALLTYRSIGRMKKTGTKTESFGDSSTTYDYATLITSDIAQMLATYRRFIVG